MDNRVMDNPVVKVNAKVLSASLVFCYDSNNSPIQ